MTMKDQTNLFGQKHIWTPFLSAKRQGRLAHAYLVFGPAGSGCMDVVRAMAKALLCPETADGFCDECSTCMRVDHGNYGDMHTIAPREGKTITLDQVRGVLDMAYQYPMEGRYRLFIIESPDKMNQESANTLLKVLEEPPSGVFFLCGSENYAAVLPTISSRCQGFRMRPLPEDEIAGRLRKEFGLGQDDALAVARLSDGSIGRAREMASSEFHEERQKAFSLILGLTERNDDALAFAAAKALASEYSKNRESLVGFLRICLGLLRDAAVLGANGSADRLIHGDLAGKISGLAGFRSGRAWPDYVDSTLEAIRKIRSNLNVELVLSNLLLSFARAE